MITGNIRNEEEQKRIGGIIKKLRLMQGFSTEDLSRKAQVDEGLLLCIEEGRYNIRLDTLSSIAEALGCKIGFVKLE